AFEPLFEKAQEYVAKYFQAKNEDPSKGTIDIFGERYILVRAASMSVDFFSVVMDLYKKEGPEEAANIARQILFDIAHAIGKQDAKRFHEKLNLKDPVEKLSVGPVHFSHSGWAFVDIFPESHPSPDENFLLVYDHVYSFESDAWLSAGKKSDFPVCVMNAGYSSGWCEESFGVTLVASEILCKVKGDDACRFVMAPPSRIAGHVADLVHRKPELAYKVARYEAPVFFKRKRYEDALKESEERFRGAFESSAIGMALVSLDGTWLRVNPSLCEIVGYPERELLTKTLKDITHPGDLEADSGYIKRLLAGEIRYYHLEKRYTHKRGHILWILLSVSLVRDAQGQPLYYIAQMKNIAERKEFEAKLLESEKRFRSLIEQAVDAIFLHDKEGRFIDVNQKACEILGYSREELLNIRVTDLQKSYSLESLKSIWDRLSMGQTLIFEALGVRKDKTEFPVEVHLGMIDYSGQECFLAFIRDIARRKEAEKRLQVAQGQILVSEKLAGIGQLSAGVCHEILNPLNIISLHVQMMLRREPEDSALREKLSKVRSEVDRIEKIVSALMTFARQKEPEVKPVQIDAELELALSLVEKDFMLDNIKIVRDYRPGLPEIKIDGDEMRQVFLNLLQNARHAMPAGGSLTIKVDPVKIEGSGHLRIQFSDTGAGIRKEHLARVFDPFFTTKPEGKGTGMGLAIVHGIVEKHRGTIAVESVAGEGATFIIDLPLS
ncbi:MAG: PAS domain S-box protein, partial [Nitrospinae bacterium]|nr:PAS domain S-box protein [Nitrospinota bacterium]